MIGPIDAGHVAHGLGSPAAFAAGVAIALFATVFAPPAARIPAACVLAAVGVAVVAGAAGPQTPFRTGLAVGLVLAAAKLATGVRFL